jgi:hypothetical protein
MLSRIRQPKDFLAGLLFIAFGGVFLYIALGYSLGTLRRMGPGWFPTTVAALLVGVGLIMLAKSFFGERRPGPAFDWMKLVVVSVALFLFSITLRGAGVLVAVFLLVMVSAQAYQPVNQVRMAMMAVGLGIFCAIVFVRFLGLPFPIIGPWLGGV